MNKSMLFFCILTFGLIRIGWSQEPFPPGFLTIKWTRSDDFTDPTGVDKNNRLNAAFLSSQPAMIPRLNKALDWFKRHEKLLDGAFRVWSRNHFSPGNPHPDALAYDSWYQSTGRLGHYYLSISSRFTSCEGGKATEYLGPAWVHIRFNHFDQIATTIRTKDGPYLLNGKPIYEIPELHASSGRIDYYEYPGDAPDYVVNYAGWWFKHAFILRNSDKPFFIPLTQREFLQEYLIGLEKFYLEVRNLIVNHTQVYSPEEILAERDARIAEIKKNAEERGLSQNSLEHSLKTTEEFYRNKLEEEKNKISVQSAEIDKQFKESTNLIKEYLDTQPESILKKPIRKFDIIFSYEVAAIQHLLEELNAPMPERVWGLNTQIVYINPEYFDATLSPDVPQMIALEIVNLENTHLHLNRLAYYLRENWDFGELMELLK